MGLVDDLAVIRALVEPLAEQYGFLGRKLLAAITEENVRIMYQRVGARGVRAAAEAIHRIGGGE